MSINKLIDNLKGMNFPRREYAVFGSGPLGIRGLREVNNLDVIVLPSVWQKLLDDGYKPDEEGFIRTKGLKISNYWWVKVKDFKYLINEADVIDGINFVRLEEVKKYKSIVGGAKEKKDIALIEKYLDLKKQCIPTGLGVSVYSDLLDVFTQKTRSIGDIQIHSLILFGSPCRNEAKGTSDLDIFVIYTGSRIQLESQLTNIILYLRDSKEYKKLKDNNIIPEIYPFLISKKNLDDTLWILLDATDHGIVLHDDGTFKEKSKRIKRNLEKLGGKRVILPNGKGCWKLSRENQLTQPIVL